MRRGRQKKLLRVPGKILKGAVSGSSTGSLRILKEEVYLALQVDF